MKNKDCPFCAELLNPDESIIKHPRFIAESQSFVLFPTTGGFVSNYQLIVPKRHINCFGELTKDQFDELKNIINWQTQINNNYFNGKTSMFEHGALSPLNESGKSIIHAHMHIFPNNISLLDELAKYKFDIISINDISGLSKVCKEHDTYLYYKDIDGSDYIITHQGLPSQFLRKILANTLNRDDWNWRENAMLEEIENNLKFYRNHPELYEQTIKGVKK